MLKPVFKDTNVSILIFNCKYVLAVKRASWKMGTKRFVLSATNVMHLAIYIVLYAQMLVENLILLYGFLSLDKKQKNIAHSRNK